MNTHTESVHKCCESVLPERPVSAPLILSSACQHLVWPVFLILAFVKKCVEVSHYGFSVYFLDD